MDSAGSSKARTNSKKTGLCDEATNEAVGMAEGSNEDSDEEGAIRYEDIYIPPPPATAFEADADGSRLIITHIVNENFKSYAGVQELGPFHKYFSAIIGPNGSGKSNVIDSMLFVFGYHAKRLRTKKVSALVHDSEENPKCTSCTVTVHFAKMIDDPSDPDAFKLVPGSAFYISRTAATDSSSFYTINGKRALFKEVGKLLRKHGIDLDHNRFLILQGEVEQISLMKPRAENENETGMLEYLEDIIGSSRFKEPIKQLGEKVDQQTAVREEKMTRFKMVKSELTELEGPMSSALRYVQLENSIINLKHKLLQKKIVLSESEAEKKKEIFVKLEEKMKILKSQLVEKRKVIQELQKSNSEYLNELSKLTSLKDKAKAAFEAKKLNDVALQTEIENVNKKRKELTKSLADEEEKKCKLEKIPDKNRETIAELQELEVKLDADRKLAETKHSEILASLQKDTQDLQDEKEKLQTELVKLKSVVDDAKCKYDTVKSELEMYTNRESSVKEKMKSLKKSTEDNVSGLKNSEEDLKRLQVEVPGLEKKLQETRSEINKLKIQEREILTERKGHQLHLEESRSAMNMNRNRGKVLNSLMEAKESGRIPGIFGRMGDLGGIDHKYDVAISTACGPLDYIVVDTVDTASACIQYLKKNDIGSATFVALDKQEKYKSVYSRPFQAPENVPRLFDLIQVSDERVRPVFYYALQDTLVADDLQQASRIGYGKKRYRVVTLNGELIEIAGTMSGGGRQKISGRMGTQAQQVTSPGDLERKERKLGELNARLEQVSQRLNVLEEELPRLEKEFRTKNTRKLQLEIEVRSLREQEPMLKKQMKNLEQQLVEATCDPKKLAQLNKAVTESKQEYDRAFEAADIVDKKVEKVHAEIIAKTKGRMESAQKKLDDATSKLDKAKKEMTRLRVAITTAVRNVEKSEVRIANMKTEIATCVERIKKCAADIKENESEAQSTLEEFEKYESQVKELEKGNKNTKTKMEELLDEENKMKSEDIDLKKEVTQAKNELEHIKSRIQADRKKMEGLKLMEEDIDCDVDTNKLNTLTTEELDKIDCEEMLEMIKNKENSMPKTKPNLGVIQEYKKMQQVLLERENDLQVATNLRNQTRDLVDTLKKNRLTEFIKGFNVISMKVKECYQMLADGGDAELELVNSMDPFLDGIKFTVRPPKKSWKEIQFLSGGEKTLSSLSLIFALHHYKPTPLYFMDEIDAALDWKNTAIVGYYLKEQTKNAQFIIVSLRENMFELADQLVGIFKTRNCTKSVTIVPRLYGQQQTNDDEQDRSV